MINIYDSKTTDFNNNGLVVLSDCESFFIEEKLNNDYTCTLEYPIDEYGKWQYLVEENIIKADGQLFRIYQKEKNLSSITIDARHIFYDLLDNFLEDVRPTATTGIGALTWVLEHTQYAHPFTATGDVVGNNTKYFVRKNVVEAILGDDGIIANWSGEIVRDNFAIQYLQARGLDRGVLISYGKNIVGIEETLDEDNVCTRCMPEGKDGLLLTEKYVDSSLINNYPHPKVKTVQFSDIDNETDLRAAVVSYISENEKPLVNYKIDFIELTKTEEYKNYAVLETIYMGDTVTIRHSRLGIDLKAKVIRTKKNILTGRLEEVELGSFKPTLANAFTGIQASVDSVASTVQTIQTQTDGKIETYFQTDDPNTWLESDRTSHNGDMWYKKNASGNCQLFRYDGPSNAWDEIKDQKALDAYSNASTAQDTADHKRRVFTVQPVPPYDVGDLWTQGSSGDLMRCTTAKATGQTYSTSDWGKASKYTDDTSLNTFVNTTYSTDKSDMNTAISNATTAMNTALGGYVLKRNGELLIMDTQDVNTAKSVSRWNLNGLAYSSTGYNGPYTTVITADGKLVINSITCAAITATLIQGGILTLGGSNNGNGYEVIKDANGNDIVTLGKDGIVATGGNISIIANTIIDPTNVWMNVYDKATVKGNEIDFNHISSDTEHIYNGKYRVDGFSLDTFDTGNKAHFETLLGIIKSSVGVEFDTVASDGTNPVKVASIDTSGNIKGKSFDVGNGFLGQGTGDGASWATYNTVISSWQGLAIG